MTFCFVFGYLKKNVLFFPNENWPGFHMRYCLFMNYEWFLQNLEKYDCCLLHLATTYDTI